MKKNIMLVFGLDSPRERYLEKSYNKRRVGDDNVYLTIDILCSALGMQCSSSDFLNVMNTFIQNKNEPPSILYADNLLKAQKDFYVSMWRINHNQEESSHSISSEQEKMLMNLMSPEVVHYLLSSWSGFLNARLCNISFHDTSWIHIL
ncbi:hypothetical protein, partial [Xenorhabdus littoralis]|uniref:hypothetical protein n=1 Tax=Xenorhabdus littoralis TaxID=2582835 RepID=UPI0029E7EC2E